jgi:hypothetical protein
MHWLIYLNKNEIRNAVYWDVHRMCIGVLFVLSLSTHAFSSSHGKASRDRTIGNNAFQKKKDGSLISGAYPWLFAGTKGNNLRVWLMCRTRYGLVIIHVRSRTATDLTGILQFLATDPQARLRFPGLPDFLRSSLERGPLSLVSTIGKLLDRKSSGSELGIRE